LPKAELDDLLRQKRRGYLKHQTTVMVTTFFQISTSRRFSSLISGVSFGLLNI